MNNGLPTGWTTASIGDVAELNPRHSRDLDEHLPISFVPMAGVNADQPKFKFAEDRLLGEVRQCFTHFAEGDVLFAKITPCMENGKAAVAEGLKNGLGCGSTEFHVMRPRHGINPSYLYRFIHQESFRRAAKQNFTGTAGQARVPISFVREAVIPLPPADEQKRIVEKLEKLLGKVSGCNSRMERFPTILKRFRQSVLAAACSGRLTADWREQNPSIEPAELLLKKMKADRIEHFTRRNGQRKYIEPEPLVEKDLPTVPDTWSWTNFDHCSWEITVGHVGPMKDRYVNDGTPFLRSQNVRPLHFTAIGIVYIPSDFHSTLAKSKLVGGEILVVRSGANTGDCCTYPVDAGEANCADLVITRPLKGLISAYGAAYVCSPFGQARLSQNETGIAQPHFNIGAMRVKAFPLPPFAEQKEIVRRVESLFTLADQLEARYKKGKAYVDKLTQSILAKAFRGELVPQDPNDEPAEKLLERIRAEKMPARKGHA